LTPFTLSPTKTPDALTPKLREACRRLASACEPLFVDKRPFPGARINKCSFNVQQFLQDNPGDMVLGWDVTIWEGVLLDCIGHAVARQDNRLLCVTPSKYPEDRLLFLPDPSLTFDFEDMNARMPVAEIALSTRPEVAQLIEVTQRERAIKVKYPVSSQPLVVQGQDAVDLQRLERLKSELAFKVTLVTADHNTRCPCGSGKKFRKCHRAIFERMLA
jgi:SEC-C motif